MPNATLNSLVLALAAAAAAPAAAEPQAVRGNQFISMMDGNTLSGTSAAGTAFNLYFLPGGIATYQDAAGTRDSGTWRLDEQGDVCVAWQTADQQDGCFRVTVDGSKVAWEGKEGGGRAALRGGITETLLETAGQ